MKRVAASAIVIVLALPVSAAEKWWDAYARGVKAVNAKQYAAGAVALQRAIAEVPKESKAIRTRNEFITYVPHFFLGIARFNLGDLDGAFGEWKTSEEQGAIQETAYYGALREWMARGKTELQRLADKAAAGPKKAADAALSRALTAQMEAVSAGGDRGDAYRTAQKKLRDALDQFNKAGTDVRAYNRVAEIAGQARDLFSASAEDAKKQRTSKPPVVEQAKVVVPQAAPPRPVIQPPPAPPVESEARVTARVAVQKFRQRLLMIASDPQYASAREDLAREQKLAEAMEARLEGESDDAALKQIALDVAARERDVSALLDRAAAKAAVLSQQQSTRSQLESAYRAFASGNLAVAEDLLTAIITRTQSSEAYLLRGCTRYTRAMLSSDPDDLLVEARLDFREALKIDGSLRLSERMFSPKLVEFFEKVRTGS